MQIAQRLGAAFVLGAVIAACGGSAATQGPAATQAGGGGGGGGSATQQPAATDAGNGGNGGNGGVVVDTSHGKAHIDIAGPASKSADLGFSPVLSHFGGTDETVVYFVATEGTEGALALTWSSGTFAAVFTSADITVSGSECTTANMKMDATSVSGSFDCPTNIVVLASGASSQNASFKGTFEARG
ncbi:MAG TPA: hypothetical protein VJ850_07120 [Candidatus Limnocylindrales bacterium]|nr:hypothetical protein [Candidatus Limnocylindrales bacterium]